MIHINVRPRKVLDMYRLAMMAAAFVLAVSSTTLAFAETITFDVRALTDEPVNLTAELDRPRGDGPFPAVVMLHGCGGPWKRWGDGWSRRLVEWGYVVLQPDSFGARDYPKGVCHLPHAIGPLRRVADAFTAKAYLEGLRYVDKTRIAVLGMSHGGWTIMYAVQNQFDDQPMRPNPFAAAVAIYPYCVHQVARLDARC